MSPLFCVALSVNFTCSVHLKYFQKQPPSGVLSKRCSENLLHIFISFLLWLEKQSLPKEYSNFLENFCVKKKSCLHLKQYCEVVFLWDIKDLKVKLAMYFIWFLYFLFDVSSACVMYLWSIGHFWMYNWYLLSGSKLNMNKAKIYAVNAFFQHSFL